jgi:hypothetical protein
LWTVVIVDVDRDGSGVVRWLLVLWFGVGRGHKQWGVHGRIRRRRDRRCSENGDGRRLVVLPIRIQHPSQSYTGAARSPRGPIRDRVHARTAALIANCIDSSVSGGISGWFAGLAVKH